jgi:DNA gyrase subunit A
MDVLEKEDLIITCKSGVTIRTSVTDIREAGRATQGVKLIRLDEGDEIAATSKIEEQDVPELDIVEGAESSAEATGDVIASTTTEGAIDTENKENDSIDDTLDNTGDETPEN